MTLEGLITGKERAFSKRVVRVDVLPTPTPVAIEQTVALHIPVLDAQKKPVHNTQGEVLYERRPIEVRNIPVFEAYEVFPEPIPPTGIRGTLSRLRTAWLGLAGN